MDDKNTKPKGTFAKLMSSPPPAVQPQHLVQETKPLIVEEKIETKAQENKKLLGARITPQQFSTFKKVYLKLNNNDSNIDKGEIVGIAIETLADLVEDSTEDFPTVNKLKSYLVNKLIRLRES